jgi:hypothetical protein
MKVRLVLVALSIALVGFPSCGSSGTAETTDTAPDTATRDDGFLDAFDVPDEAGPDLQDVVDEDQGEPGIDINAPGHPHPYWKDVSWVTFWPANGAKATFHVVTTQVSPQELDVPGFIVEPVKMATSQDESFWTRLSFGSMKKPFDNGMAVYFDRKVPWRIKVKGVEVFDPEYIDPRYEIFDTTLEIPLDLPLGQTSNIQTLVHTNIAGIEAEVGVSVEVRAVSYDMPCPAPFQSPSGCAELRVTLNGELVGGLPMVCQLILHPQHHLLSWTNAPPAFSSIVISDAGWPD